MSCFMLELLKYSVYFIVFRPDNWAFYTSFISTCLKMVDKGFIPSPER